MRILFVTPEYVTEEENFDGGLSNYLHRVALSLQQFGHEPVIVVSSDREETLSHKGVEVHRVPVVTPRWYRMFYVQFNRYLPGMDWVFLGYSLNREVRKIIRHARPDVVQYPNIGALGLFRPRGIPAVIRISSNEKLFAAAYGAPITRYVRQHQFLEKLSFRMVDALFAPSNLLSQDIKIDTGLDVRVIESPFVLDAGNFDYRHSDDIERHLKGKEYLLFFGSVGILKGVGVIAEMIHDLLEKHPDLYFVFVGKDMGYNGRPIMDYLEEQARGHNSRIIYRNKMSHNELYPVIESAKLVVLPSRLDNFPNTCIEAMALRKVVVGTRGTSFEQLIDDRESGFLCNKDDPQDLLRVIDEVVSLSGEEMREIGENACQRIRSLSPDRIVPQLLDLYNRV
jgi:glycosyltransferase involved in cell wall biosynthesis